MAHPYHHALSSVRKWGGQPEEYLHLHDWFDASKAFMADYRHRALRHHAQGIFELERAFGISLTLSTGRIIPTRWVGEQHVREDLGRIPTVADWYREIRPQPWMGRATTLGVEDAPRGGKAKAACRYSTAALAEDDNTFTANVFAQAIPSNGKDVLVWSLPGFVSPNHAQRAADQEAQRLRMEGEAAK